ncbi:MAG: DnaJ domain-containing protein [Pirellulales bacterium]|nr:DnaJ domain-containing protein [Pirellulales bacterium]
MVEDYYKILGVRWNASADQIGHAYRVLVRQYHPDVNQELETYDKFQEVQKAFEVLSDPIKRAEYNRSRTKVAPRPSKGIYNPSNLPNTRYSGDMLDDKYKLILVNIICVFLMVLVSGIVSLSMLDYYNTPANPDMPPVYNPPQDNRSKNIPSIKGVKVTVITTLEFVVVPFIMLILCINIGYVATHRDS